MIYTHINGLYCAANLSTVTNDDDAISAAEIRALADAMGCRTQTELAKRLCVTQPRISQILSGTHPVKKGPLMQLIRNLQAAQVDKTIDPSTTAKQEGSRNVRARTPKRRSRRS